jgi:hypothetical protein
MAVPAREILIYLSESLRCYRSYLRFRKRVWYASWPHRPINTPAAFGKHWQKLLKSFLEGYQEVNGMLVRYEDVCSGRLGIDRLAYYLQLELKAEILSVRIAAGRANRDLYNPATPAATLRILNKAVQPLASQLGYKA